MVSAPRAPKSFLTQTRHTATRECVKTRRASATACPLYFLAWRLAQARKLFDSSSLPSYLASGHGPSDPVGPAFLNSLFCFVFGILVGAGAIMARLFNRDSHLRESSFKFNFDQRHVLAGQRRIKLRQRPIIAVTTFSPLRSVQQRSRHNFASYENSLLTFASSPALRPFDPNHSLEFCFAKIRILFLDTR